MFISYFADTRVSDIDSTLSCMQKILDVLDTASRVKPVIDEG
jgi:hypothetical protein